MINTKCKLCYFNVKNESGEQVGCTKNRLDIWQKQNLTELDTETNSFIINTVCNTYCETAEHAKKVDEIIYPTCDIIIVVDNNDIDCMDDILYTCTDILKMSNLPKTVTIASNNKHILYSTLSRHLDDMFCNLPYNLIRWYEFTSIESMIDEAIRKSAKNRLKPSRYIYTVKAGEAVKDNLLDKLNRLENIELKPFVCIHEDHNYNHLLVSRVVYNVLDKNNKEWLLNKVINKAIEDKMEQLILKWNQL